MLEKVYIPIPIYFTFDLFLITKEQGNGVFYDMSHLLIYFQVIVAQISLNKLNLMYEERDSVHIYVFVFFQRALHTLF